MFRFGLPVRSASEPPWHALLWIAAVYPVLEEYVFRGGLQATLYRNTRMSWSWLGISAANVTTSIVFAAMHLISQPPAWAMLVFFPSLVFGWVRDRYDRLQASIVLHVVYNAGFVWFFSA